MIYLAFSPISSPDGKRDLFVDFTDAIEDGELITSATVVSSDPTTLEVSSVAVNTSPTETADVGKGVHFSVTTLVGATMTATVEVAIVGDSGSADAWLIAIPVKPHLTQ